MKAEIKENGQLVLIPENGIESYALNKWFSGYLGKGEETLMVNFTVDDTSPSQERS